MPADADMRGRLEQVEAKVDQLELAPTHESVTQVGVLDVHSEKMSELRAAFANLGDRIMGIQRELRDLNPCVIRRRGVSERKYSPSTLSKDYAISPTLFHWESQSTTSQASPTRQRCIHHRERGATILLFVRQRKDAEWGTAPYTLLGPVDYVSHHGRAADSIRVEAAAADAGGFLSASESGDGVGEVIMVRAGYRRSPDRQVLRHAHSDLHNADT